MGVKLFMLKGLPGAGKTSWAKKYQEFLGPAKVTRVNKDDLRGMLDNGVWSKDNERFVLETRDSIICAALGRGRHVIVDDTNLDPKHEKALQILAEKARAEFEVVSFVQIDGMTVEETYEICLKRNAERFGSARVPEKVIKEMYEKYLRPPAPTVPYDDSLPDCILVDVDGTLADKGDRNPFDWARVGEDRPIQSIVDIVHHYFWETDIAVIFLSGRDSICRGVTKKWIESDEILGCSLGDEELCMRPEGDTRDDRIVKREIYENHIRGKYNVRFVLDDRNKVVEMWRSLGLTCLQVAPGDF